MIIRYTLIKFCFYILPSFYWFFLQLIEKFIEKLIEFFPIILFKRLIFQSKWKIQKWHQRQRAANVRIQNKIKKFIFLSISSKFYCIHNKYILSDINFKNPQKMMQPLGSFLKKYKKTNQPYSKMTLQYLRILARMFESKSDDFFESIRGLNYAKELPISSIKFTNHFITLTNLQEQSFKGIIRQDFEDILDSEFLSGFIEQAKKRILVVKKNQENKQYRGRVFTFCKYPQQEQKGDKNYAGFDRPLILRLDYYIFCQQINYPALTQQNIGEAVLVAYTLSSIKKEVLTQKQITYYINDSYRLIQQSKTQSLINKVVKSKWFNIYKNITIYKNLDKNKLVYNPEASKNTLPSLKKISLALIYTKWESGYITFATGFLFDLRAVLTSAKNIIQGKNFVISEVQVCLNPHQNEREWISIDRKNIRKLQGSETVLLILPQLKNTLKKRVAIKIQDHSNCLPSYVYSCHVYGFQFHMEGQNLVFNTTLSTSVFEEKPSFDSFYNIKSNSSAGGLVFFIHNNVPTLFGVYNPFNKSVFNFDLFHGQFSLSISAAIQRMSIIIQNQALIDDDDRQAVKFTQLKNMPYSAIGMIYTKLELYDKRKKFKKTLNDGAQGTGTFIAPNIILTCAHNVLGKDKENKEKDYTYRVKQYVEFYPGLSKQNNENSLDQVINGNYLKYTIPIEDIYVPQAYTSNYLTNNESKITSDIAVLYVKDISHTSYIPIKSVEESQKGFWESTKLKICGYPGESEGTMKQAQGHAINISLIQKQKDDFKQFPDTIYYEIDVTQGNSGTAVIVQSKNNQFEVVAIHTLGHTHEKQGRKVGLINSGLLLVGQNLKFVQQKLENLNGTGKFLKSTFSVFCKTFR